MGGPVQDREYVVHEEKVSYNPGIIERRRVSKSVPIEWIERLADEKLIVFRVNRAPCKMVRSTDGILVGAGARVVTILFNLGGWLRGMDGLAVEGIGERVRVLVNFPYSPSFVLLDRLFFLFLAHFPGSRNSADGFLGCSSRKPLGRLDRCGSHLISSSESLDGFPCCLLVCVAEGDFYFGGGKGWDPEPADNQAQQPRPEGGSRMAVRRAVSTREGGTNNGKEVYDDDPCDANCCCDRPDIPLVEPADDLLRPSTVGRNGSEKAFIFCQLERSLLKAYQCLRYDRLVLALDVFRPSINRPRV